jgi:inner membrane protein involved in colicin E2 resistance
MLSISVISHHSESIYKDLLMHFQLLLLHISPDIRFTPEYAMTDCDVAERYVFYVTCFTINNVFHSLFCILLHVIILFIVSYVAP